MDADDLADLFSAFGPVTVRRMFGSRGVFAGGVMFALESRGVVYLRTDEASRERFRAAGSEPFTYPRRGVPTPIIRYWRVPDAVLDDAEELAAWSRMARTASPSAAIKKKAKKASGEW
jgi:DNA transformation protein